MFRRWVDDVERRWKSHCDPVTCAVNNSIRERPGLMRDGAEACPLVIMERDCRATACQQGLSRYTVPVEWIAHSA